MWYTVVLRANRSQWLVSKPALRIPGICGQTSFAAFCKLARAPTSFLRRLSCSV